MEAIGILKIIVKWQFPCVNNASNIDHNDEDNSKDQILLVCPKGSFVFLTLLGDETTSNPNKDAVVDVVKKFGLPQNIEGDGGELVYVEAICYLKEFLNTGFLHVDPYPDFSNIDKLLKAGMDASTLGIGFLDRQLASETMKEQNKSQSRILILEDKANMSEGSIVTDLGLRLEELSLKEKHEGRPLTVTVILEVLGREIKGTGKRDERIQLFLLREKY